MKKQIKTVSALRIKITGKCNRSCSFCHEEGGMKNIGVMLDDRGFRRVSSEIAKACGIERFMFTGGEPTLNKDLGKLIHFSSNLDFIKEVSVTTNGVKLLSVDDWIELKRKGLDKVIFSIHDANVEDFFQLETRIGVTMKWAQNALRNQFTNVVNALNAGLRVRTNTVAYATYEKLELTIRQLLSIQNEYRSKRLEVRVLNDLNDVDKSQFIINRLLDSLSARLERVEKRLGSSSVVKVYKIEGENILSIKLSYPFYLPVVCDSCKIRSECKEGFYGLRLEKRNGDYYVRLCVYRNDSGTLIKWNDFLKSEELIRSINNLD